MAASRKGLLLFLFLSLFFLFPKSVEVANPCHPQALVGCRGYTGLLCNRLRYSSASSLREGSEGVGGGGGGVVVVVVVVVLCSAELEGQREARPEQCGPQILFTSEARKTEKGF